MNVSKEIKVGLLFITSFVAIYWGLNFLKGKSVFDKRNIYYALYASAEGLNTASQITLNGCSIGKIQRIEILPEQNHKVLVTLMVDKKIKLTNTTIARLDTSNLLNGRSIDLLLKEGSILESNDTLLTDSMPTLTTQVMKEVLPALQDTKSITLLTNQFMKNLVENTARINAIFKNLENTSQQLYQIVNSNRSNLGMISYNMANISSILSDKEVGIYRLLSRLQGVMQEIEKLPIGTLSNRTNEILTQFEIGTMAHANQALLDLDQLLIDIKAHPSRYVHFSFFGANSIFTRVPPRKKQISLPASAK
jgi:phospholipid/cholesterol/gamma-HCH transport system substrate-binding protein